MVSFLPLLVMFGVLLGLCVGFLPLLIVGASACVSCFLLYLLWSALHLTIWDAIILFSVAVAAILVINLRREMLYPDHTPERF